MNSIQRWLQRRREAKYRSELEFVQRQISVLTEENGQLRQTATQCARESAGRADETRSQRMAGRSEDLLENSRLFAHYAEQEKRLKRKLKLAA